MNDRPPTLEEVDEELLALDNKLAEYKRLLVRQQTLLEYKAILDRLGLTHSKASPAFTPATAVSPAIGTTETSELAKKILASAPQMSEGDIVKEALRLGWTGSGDEAKDRNRFYAAMHRKRDVFEKVAGVASTWRLKR